MYQFLINRYGQRALDLQRLNAIKAGTAKPVFLEKSETNVLDKNQERKLATRMMIRKVLLKLTKILYYCKNHEIDITESILITKCTILFFYNNLRKIL